MRRPVAVLAAATFVVAAGCARPPAPPPRHADPAAAVTSLTPLVAAEEQTRPPHGHGLAPSSAHPRGWPRPADGAAADPAAAAADEIVRRFEREQLTVLDLQTETEPATPQKATVNVAVVYGTGQAHPDHARYRVHLTQLDARWVVVAVEEAP